MPMISKVFAHSIHCLRILWKKALEIRTLHRSPKLLPFKSEGFPEPGIFFKEFCFFLRIPFFQMFQICYSILSKMALYIKPKSGPAFKTNNEKLTEILEKKQKMEKKPQELSEKGDFVF